MLKPGQHTIFIIGLGQIGGSLGFDLTRGGLADEIIGYDISNSVCQRARRKGAVNRTVRSLEKGVSQSDIIILATPIRRTISLLSKVCRLAGSKKIIIDVAGTKTEIFRKLRNIPRKLDYFSCHPMCGTEIAGFEGAQKDLFRDADFIIIPYGTVRAESLKAVKALFKSIGAKPLCMTSDEHDENIAITSHLPYALAISLSLLIEKRMKKDIHLSRLLGGSFRSATRVAMSSPELVEDMFLTNRKNISSALRGITNELRILERMISGEDAVGLKRLISRARKFTEKVHHG